MLRITSQNQCEESNRLLIHQLQASYCISMFKFYNLILYYLFKTYTNQIDKSFILQGIQKQKLDIFVTPLLISSLFFFITRVKNKDWIHSCMVDFISDSHGLLEFCNGESRLRCYMYLS